MNVPKNPITREMARLYQEEGLTMPEIAKKFGVIKQAVHARFVRAGIPKRPRKHTQIDKGVLQKLYGENISIKKIADQLGVYPDMVYDALTFYQIPKREPIKPGGKYTGFMRSLTLGQTSEIEIDTKASHAQLHRAANLAEIKISIRSSGAGKFKVTRIK